MTWISHTTAGYILGLITGAAAAGAQASFDQGRYLTAAAFAAWAVSTAALVPVINKLLGKR